ncbi:MAG: T9SS type A sorting domain-containing protein [Bacteroidales bacterium]|nr:T9SS type A sorting domain-containing protein [Bacteroidales bacterium]
MKLSIYPNPTKGLFLVELDKEWMGTHLQVVLLTSHGDALTKRSLTVGTEEFDLSNYPAGVYLLQFVVGEESQIWKIVKY